MFSGGSKEISATKWIKKIFLSFRRHLVKFPWETQQTGSPVRKVEYCIGMSNIEKDFIQTSKSDETW